MGGHVAMTFAPIAAVVQQIKGRRLRALGVTGATRSAALPEVATIAEAGVPGYEAAGWNAMLAPRATPQAVIVKVNATLNDSLRATRVSDVLVSSGADAAAGSPDDLARFLQSEMAKWAKVVKAAGIRAE
jgi:tripartite-type tricarboxylate transporter receptor subunit TctC